MSTTTALDLFAGTGWGVACHDLGIEEQGVELMPEAVASREAAGMTTLYRDVWEGLESSDSMDYDLLIASPPCQTFSAAGAGAGRKALDTVLSLIDQGAYHRLADLKAFGETHDPKTALVLTPLAHVARDTPRLVVWEQVPPVLPVWEAAAVKMREMGYSVVTGIVNAEQYGVPQTRRRAILVARWDAEAKLPIPTYSRYYSRDPKRLDDGVLPWVSMAEALGGGMEPGGFRWEMRPEIEAWGDTSLPAPTVAGDSRLPRRGYRKGTERQMDGALRLTAEEAAVLQSYPANFPFQGTKTKRFLQIGNAVPPLLARAILAEVTS